ncbi:MAG: hypothetical protein IJX13_01785 [Clostridia bacterium]|nr:hypothetical protein [Clostridia bacterium]
MKKKLILLISALLLLATVICLSACAQWEPPYSSLNKDGYTVSIRFDAGEAKVKGKNEVTVVEVFDLSAAEDTADGKKAIKILAPEDERRDRGLISLDYANHFLAGWYTQRTEIVGEDGTVSYEYANKWDFESDQLIVDPTKQYSSDDPVMTLYAAWIPNFTYEFYAPEGENGEMVRVDDSQAPVRLIDLSIPQWDMETGKLDYSDFLKRDGKTFDGAYFDENMTQPIVDVLAASEKYVDYEKGIALANTVKVYTTWLDGTWFKIYNADQFKKNASINANYIICNDLDFTDITWMSSFAGNEFNGTIKTENGATFKFSNVEAVQGQKATGFGGLFGSLGADAVIENIVFENVSYTITNTTRITDSMTIGLFTGRLDEGAALSNVSVSGKLIFKNFNPLNCERYTVNLLIGNGVSDVLDASQIEFEVLEECPVNAELDSDTLEFKLTERESNLGGE